MSIVSSEAIVDDYTQAGGGRYVVERHTDSTGTVHQVGPYLVDQGYDVQARLVTRAAEIDEQLAEAEAAALLGV